MRLTNQHATTSATEESLLLGRPIAVVEPACARAWRLSLPGGATVLYLTRARAIEEAMEWGNRSNGFLFLRSATRALTINFKPGGPYVVEFGGQPALSAACTMSDSVGARAEPRAPSRQ